MSVKESTPPPAWWGWVHSLDSFSGPAVSLSRLIFSQQWDVYLYGSDF